MQSNQFNTGVVLTSDPGTYNIRVTLDHQELTGHDMVYPAIMLSSVFGVMFGYKEITIPPAGSRVFFYIPPGEKIAYILGIIQPRDQTIKQQIRSAYGQGDCLSNKSTSVGEVNGEQEQQPYSKQITANNQRPIDMNSAEYGIGNAFNVMLGMFQGMAKLGASELAQIQFYLYDDLVRLISHNFEHFSSFGELTVKSDNGHVNLEFVANPTSADTAVGFETTDTPSRDDKTNVVSMLDAQLKMQERIKLYVGRLGDLVQFFITNPSNEGNFTGVEKEKGDTALFHVNASTDGGLYVRTAKETFIEKLNWIPLPQRLRQPDDPEGDDKIEYAAKEEFKFDTAISAKGSPVGYALQLRDYAAWLQSTISSHFFKLHEKDFSVGTKEKTEKANTRKTVDGFTTMSLGKYTLKTSGIYINQNGSVVLKDAWGSAIVMEGGDISLQPARDLVTQPLRNSIEKVGGTKVSAVRKNIEVSTTEGAIRTKSEKGQHYYSNSSGILLHSAGTNLSKPYPEADAIEHVPGVYIKSATTFNSFSEQGTKLHAVGQLMLASDTRLYFTSTETLLAEIKDVLINAERSFQGLAGSNMSLLSGGTSAFAGASNTVLGQKDSPLAVKYDEKSAFVDVIYGVMDVESNMVARTTFEEAIKSVPPFESAESHDTEFRYPNSTAYGLVGTEDRMFQTMAQQEGEFKKLLTNKWTETMVTETLPYPGIDLYSSFLVKSLGLNNLELDSSGDLENKEKTINESRLVSVTMDEYTVI